MWTESVFLCLSPVMSASLCLLLHRTAWHSVAAAETNVFALTRSSSHRCIQMLRGVNSQLERDLTKQSRCGKNRGDISFFSAAHVFD